MFPKIEDVKYFTPKDAPKGRFNHFGAFFKIAAASISAAGGAWVKGSIPGKESTILLDVSLDSWLRPPRRE